MNENVIIAIISGIIFYFIFNKDKIPTMVNSKISAMARAIQEFEGWTVGSVSQRNNNPGNLKFASQAGAVGQDQYGHAMFDSYANGWLALLNQIKMALDGSSRVYNADMSYYEFFERYAEDNSTEYANYVAGRLNVSPQDTLRDTLLA